MKRGFSARLSAIPLFWKVFCFIFALLFVVVGLAEGIFEPLAQFILKDADGGFKAWHELSLWALSILVPSVICGFVLSGLLTAKLNKIAKASKALARGNLEVRLPETGNAKDAFDALSHSFNEMAAVIKRQRHDERQLLVNISHELRSPLTRMSVATDLLDRKKADPEIVAITRRLEKEVTRMNEMVSLLLEQARDKLVSFDKNETVDLSRILNDLADDFAFQGEADQKKVHKDIESGLVVHGNAQLLERMAGNIIANAVFYTPAKSAVHVSGGRHEDGIVIRIRDFGPGVPEEQLADIFRAFYRVDGSRARSSGGVGLGLALAREAAIQHGGDIVAHNASPGLCVTVTLPAYAD